MPRPKRMPRSLVSSSQGQEAADDGGLTAKLSAYLGAHPGASQRQVERYLQRDCSLSAGEAGELAAAVMAKLASHQAQVREADRLVLRLLCQGALGAGQEALSRAGGWPMVIQRAHFHQVSPYLYHLLNASGRLAALPQAAAGELQRAYLLTREQNAHLFAELARVLSALGGQGIPAITLKGAALAPYIYAEVGLRTMADVDLLVRPEDAGRAEAALADLGYGLNPAAPDLRPPGFLRAYGGSAEYARPAAGVHGPLMIDLHWRLTNSEWIRRATRLPLDALWATARPWSHGGAQALRLAPFYEAAHLALHLLKHRLATGTLKMLLDLHLLASAQEADPMTWGEQARACRVAGPMYLVLALCARLLGSPAAGALADHLAPGPWRRRWLERAFLSRGSDLLSDELGGWPKLGLQLALQDDLGAVPGIAFRVLFPEGEWLRARYDLGQEASLWPHRLTHPLRVLRTGEL